MAFQSAYVLQIAVLSDKKMELKDEFVGLFVGKFSEKLKYY